MGDSYVDNLGGGGGEIIAADPHVVAVGAGGGEGGGGEEGEESEAGGDHFGDLVGWLVVLRECGLFLEKSVRRLEER